MPMESKPEPVGFPRTWCLTCNEPVRLSLDSYPAKCGTCRSPYLVEQTTRSKWQQEHVRAESRARAIRAVVAAQWGVAVELLRHALFFGWAEEDEDGSWMGHHPPAIAGWLGDLPCACDLIDGRVTFESAELTDGEFNTP